jgi:hypothetical protein
METVFPLKVMRFLTFLEESLIPLTRIRACSVCHGTMIATAAVDAYTRGRPAFVQRKYLEILGGGARDMIRLGLQRRGNIVRLRQPLELDICNRSY